MKTCLILQRVTYLKQFFLLNGTVSIKTGLGTNLHDFFIPHLKTDIIFAKSQYEYIFYSFTTRDTNLIFTRTERIYTYTNTHLHKCMCVSVFVSAWTLYPLQ